MTEKKQILKSASIITLVTMVSRSLGYVRDQRITFLLGTSLSANSFVLAYRIPNRFRRLGMALSLPLEPQTWGQESATPEIPVNERKTVRADR